MCSFPIPTISPILHYYGANPRHHLILSINISVSSMKSQGLIFFQHKHNITISPDIVWSGKKLTAIVIPCKDWEPPPYMAWLPASHLEFICFLPHSLPCSQTGHLPASETHQLSRALALAILPARMLFPQMDIHFFPCPSSLSLWGFLWLLYSWLQSILRSSLDTLPIPLPCFSSSTAFDTQILIELIKPYPQHNIIPWEKSPCKYLLNKCTSEWLNWVISCLPVNQWDGGIKGKK